jgi:hypothetical protein
MEQPSIELISCESGDWEVLKFDDEIIYEGHEIPTDVWLGIIQSLGCDVATKVISDEEMENGEY